MKQIKEMTFSELSDWFNSHDIQWQNDMIAENDGIEGEELLIKLAEQYGIKIND